MAKGSKTGLAAAGGSRKADAEKLVLYRKAARVANKACNALITKTRKVDRWLDRQRARKAAVDWEKAMVVDPMFRDAAGAMTALEKALADMVSVAGY